MLNDIYRTYLCHLSFRISARCNAASYFNIIHCMLDDLAGKYCLLNKHGVLLDSTVAILSSFLIKCMAGGKTGTHSIRMVQM